MILSRSPLRITAGGGGSDLSSYYSKYGGFCISVAIDQYVYVAITKTCLDHMVVRYSKIENVKSREEIQHPIIREALKLLNINDVNIEITSMADQSAGTGLGSSGSFTTALLKGLHKFKKTNISPQELAEMACHIEIDLLGEPIGKQDQYIAAVGGLTVFDFEKNGNVKFRPLNVSEETATQLQDNLVMFSTGTYRSASSVLKEQNIKSLNNDQGMIDNLHYIKELGHQSLDALESGNLYKFGEIMNTHWEHKKKRSSIMSNSDIDKWYKLGLENGAVGGKLIGAGSGGFILFYTEEKSRLVKAMGQANLHQVKINFDYEGTKIL